MSQATPNQRPIRPQARSQVRTDSQPQYDRSHQPNTFTPQYQPTLHSQYNQYQQSNLTQNTHQIQQQIPSQEISQNFQNNNHKQTQSYLQNNQPQQNNNQPQQYHQTNNQPQHYQQNNHQPHQYQLNNNQPQQFQQTNHFQQNIPAFKPDYSFGNHYVQEFQASATGQLGTQLASSAFAQARDQVNQNVNKWINLAQIKFFFNVSTSYVYNKLILLVFPFRHQVLMFYFSLGREFCSILILIGQSMPHHVWISMHPICISLVNQY
jgi:hypothetical protein